MATVLADDQIASLLIEPKVLPPNWESRLKLREKANQCYSQRELELDRADKTQFRLVLRRSILNVLDFSIILVFVDADSADYRLCRFNGRHPSDHTNKVEKARGEGLQKFRNAFHIHRATERYQIAGYEIDGYAEPTSVYDSFETALKEFLALHGFVKPAAIEGPMGPDLFDRKEGAKS